VAAAYRSIAAFSADVSDVLSSAAPTFSRSF
jgi:hypothetical protein